MLGVSAPSWRAEGKPIPGDLRREVATLKDAIEREDIATAKPKSHVDDEYAGAGLRDPKVCITTSREPSSRLKQFVVEMRLVVPNSQRINRGNTTIKEIVGAAREADFTDLIVIQETRGEPDALIISHLPYGPTAFFSLSNTVMRHDIEKEKGKATVSEAYPHLIFHNFKTPLGERFRTLLTHLFPVPKDESKRIMTFSNDSDFIAFRHHTYDKSPDAKPGAPLAKKDIVLKEIGPRFDLHPYMLRLGTVEQEEAETEWALRSFINTARKTDKL